MTETSTGLKQQIRTAPYYNTNNKAWEYSLMRNLRAELLPKIQRRMPWHHLSGWRGGFPVQFIARHKKQYGYFVRGDISRFYPSVRHSDLIMYMQLAYRDLLGLPYVPKKFRGRFVAPVRNWTKSLPLDERGIPLASPVSALLAPLMLVPLWLKLAKTFDVRLMVYADDFIVLCKTKETCGDVFAFIHNTLLRDYDLQLQPKKTCSGRFATDEVDFCGWNFKGGYARISPAKTEAFGMRMQEVVRSYKRTDVHPFIKRINYKLDGFGNYYKDGHVAKQFAELDIYTRRLVRKWLLKNYSPDRHNNEALQALGLHLLEDKLSNRKKPAAAVSSRDTQKAGQRPLLKANVSDKVVLENRQCLREQLSQLIRLQRSGNRHLRDIAEKLVY